MQRTLLLLLTLAVSAFASATDSITNMINGHWLLTMECGGFVPGCSTPSVEKRITIQPDSNYADSIWRFEYSDDSLTMVFHAYFAYSAMYSYWVIYTPLRQYISLVTDTSLVLSDGPGIVDGRQYYYSRFNPPEPAAEYIPFPTDSACWTIMTMGTSCNLGIPACTDTTMLSINGDTIIHEQAYHKIIKNSEHLIGFLREDTIKKVYYRQKDAQNEILLYDFNISIGDSVCVNGSFTDTSDYLTYYVDSIGYSFPLSSWPFPHFADQNRRMYRLSSSDGYNTTFWIEGVGNISGLLALGPLVGEYRTLTGFCDHCANAGQIAIETEVTVQPSISIGPNPSASSIICTNNNPGHTFSAYIYTIKGQLVAQFLNRNQNTIVWKAHAQPSGIYVVKIISGNSARFHRVTLVK